MISTELKCVEVPFNYKSLSGFMFISVVVKFIIRYMLKKMYYFMTRLVAAQQVPRVQLFLRLRVEGLFQAFVLAVTRILDPAVPMRMNTFA